MATQYTVRGWNDTFENSQSRKYKRLTWVPVPNKHDGKSYRRLIVMPNGPALYAAWLLVVQVASKCPKRGVLADEDGPLTAEDLSLKTGCPEPLMSEALHVLSSPDIHWLEAEGDAEDEVGVDQESATSPLPVQWNESPQNRTEGNGTEENGIEGEQKEAASAAVGSSKVSKRRPKSDAPIPLPPELDTPEARTALDEYREHRRQKRTSLTPLAERKLLGEWAGKGSIRFVAAVNHSIANGWQGVFEANNGHGKTPSQPDLMDSLQRFVDEEGES